MKKNIALVTGGFSGEAVISYKSANTIDKNLDREKPISLIFLDLNLPGKNGFEALRELKQDEDCTHIPTVVLTTSSSDRDRNQSYAMGASCFLSKPNSFELYMKMLTSIFKLYIHPGVS